MYEKREVIYTARGCMYMKDREPALKMFVSRMIKLIPLPVGGLKKVTVFGQGPCTPMSDEKNDLFLRLVAKRKDLKEEDAPGKASIEKYVDFDEIQKS